MKKEKEVVETPESKVAEISKEIIKVEKQARAIVVKTQEDYEEASKFLSGVVKPRLNRVNELVKFFTDPFKEARRVALANMNSVEALFNKQVSALEGIESKVKSAMSVYLKEQQAIADKEEARLQKIRDDANAKREEKGQDVIIAPVKSVERVDTTIKTVDGGKTVGKKVWKFEVLNYKKLDADIIEETLAIAQNDGIQDKIIRRKVNLGVRTLSGVRIYEDYDISVSASK